MSLPLFLASILLINLWFFSEFSGQLAHTLLTCRAATLESDPIESGRISVRGLLGNVVYYLINDDQSCA